MEQHRWFVGVDASTQYIAVSALYVSGGYLQPERYFACTSPLVGVVYEKRMRETVQTDSQTLEYRPVHCVLTRMDPGVAGMMTYIHALRKKEKQRAAPVTVFVEKPLSRASHKNPQQAPFVKNLFDQLTKQFDQVAWVTPQGAKLVFTKNKKATKPDMVKRFYSLYGNKVWWQTCLGKRGVFTHGIQDIADATAVLHAGLQQTRTWRVQQKNKRRMRKRLDVPPKDQDAEAEANTEDEDVEEEEDDEEDDEEEEEEEEEDDDKEEREAAQNIPLPQSVLFSPDPLGLEHSLPFSAIPKDNWSRYDKHNPNINSMVDSYIKTHQGTRVHADTAFLRTVLQQLHVLKANVEVKGSGLSFWCSLYTQVAPGRWSDFLREAIWLYVTHEQSHPVPFWQRWTPEGNALFLRLLRAAIHVAYEQRATKWDVLVNIGMRLYIPLRSQILYDMIRLPAQRSPQEPLDFVSACICEKGVWYVLWNQDKTRVTPGRAQIPSVLQKLFQAFLSQLSKKEQRCFHLPYDRKGVHERSMEWLKTTRIIPLPPTDELFALKTASSTHDNFLYNLRHMLNNNFFFLRQETQLSRNMFVKAMRHSAAMNRRYYTSSAPEHRAWQDLTQQTDTPH